MAIMLNVTKRERETETTGCHNVEILNTLAKIVPMYWRAEA